VQEVHGRLEDRAARDGLPGSGELLAGLSLQEDSPSVGGVQLGLEDSEPSSSAPPGEAVAHLQGRERDRYRQLNVDVYAAGDVVLKRRPPRR
jgi:hypothetical protein